MKFRSDTKSLVGTVKKTSTLPEVIQTSELWKSDTKKVAGGPLDHVSSVPRGQKISEAKPVKEPKKPKIPRGVKVSEFVQETAPSPPISQPAAAIVEEEKKKKGSKKKTKPAEEAEKPAKVEKKKTTKSKSKKAETEPLPNVIQPGSLMAEIKSEIAANSTAKEEVVPLVDDLRAELGKEDEHKFLKYIDEEHQLNKRKLFNRYIRILDKYQLDEKFLAKNLPKYPLISLDMMIENREQYDELEFVQELQVKFERRGNGEERQERGTGKYQHQLRPGQVHTAVRLAYHRLDHVRETLPEFGQMETGADEIYGHRWVQAVPKGPTRPWYQDPQDSRMCSQERTVRRRVC